MSINLNSCDLDWFHFHTEPVGHGKYFMWAGRDVGSPGNAITGAVALTASSRRPPLQKSRPTVKYNRHEKCCNTCLVCCVPVLIFIQQRAGGVRATASLWVCLTLNVTQTTLYCAAEVRLQHSSIGNRPGSVSQVQWCTQSVCISTSPSNSTQTKHWTLSSWGSMPQQPYALMQICQRDN